MRVTDTVDGVHKTIIGGSFLGLRTVLCESDGSARFGNR